MKKINLLAFILVVLAAFTGCKKEPLDNKTTHPYGAGKGQETVYIQTDLGVGSINVYIDGVFEGTITHYHSSIDCGSGDINVIKPAGTYSLYAVSTNGTKWNTTITFTEDLCNTFKLTGSGSGGGGGGSSTGKVYFWTNTALTGGPITVNVAGQSGTISSSYTSAPGWGMGGNANFQLAPGTYSYSASSSTGTWNGTVTSTSGGIYSMCLYNSGGGSGGGGGGGGTGVGNGMFWCQTDLGHGPITVTCSSYTSTINMYYGSMPSCGSTGCANFNLPVGTYSYTGVASDGYTWNGSITISNGGCMRIEFIN